MQKLTRLCLDHPLAAWLGLFALTGLAALGLLQVETKFGYRVLIGDEHPTIQTIDSIVAEFGGGLPMSIVWECGKPPRPCADVFDPVSLAMAYQLTEEIGALASVRSVWGIANAPIMTPAIDGFAVRRLVEYGLPAAEVRELASVAVQDRFWEGAIVSSDGLVAAIVVQAVDTEPDTQLSLYDSVSELLEPYEEEGFRFFLVGDIPATVVGGRDLAESSARLIPVMVAVISLVLLWLTRNMRESAAALISVGIGLVWTLGCLGWLGWPQDGILEVLAPLILVIGVCDGVHLLSRVAPATVEADESQLKARLVIGAESVGLPCMITSLTSAAAFLSFTTSSLATFQRFGAIAAFGVMACLVLTFSLLPLLVSILGARKRPDTVAPEWIAALEGIARVSTRRAVPILGASLAVAVACGVGWSRLQVDNAWLESFGEKSSAVQAIRFAERHLGPSETLEVVLEFPPNSKLQDPRTLRIVDDLSHAFEEIDRLGRARSILDLLKRANRLVNGDDSRFEAVGATEGRNAELLELIAFESSGALERWVTLDRRKIRISVGADEQSYQDRAAAVSAAKAAVEEKVPAEWAAVLSGELVVGYEWLRDVQSTQLRSFPAAFGIVLVLIAFFLRSFALALLAMIPALLPVLAALGTMGWVGMDLDVGRAMIGAVVIGIGVDDAVHILHAYARRRRQSESRVIAIRGAMLEVGRAVVTTSVALAIGFLTLMGSAWQTIASFGFLVSLAVAAALVATLFVLPASVAALDRMGLGE